MATNPSLKVTIPTNDYTKPLLYEESTFTVTNASENIIVVKNSDGFVDVPKGFIDVVKKIVVIAPTDNNTLSNSPITTLRLTVDNGPDPEYNIDLPLQNFFMYQPSNTFGGYIKNIKVANASTSDVTVTLRIYG
jgi:hypothetical protein